MKIHESTENYLETIYMLTLRGNPIRSVDIANELGFSRPSVSVAMKKLRTEGHIASDANGFIILTDSGNAIAIAMHERHVILSQWLIELGVDPKIAVNDACKIEHIMSEQSFSAIKEHIKKL
ncbi:MAG: metal-dependent transcriptional regulator [Oscillospiraceae bacterium]|nr:metal-dependent transcriptional regulator [Oscillospiraceae bacterium]